MRWRVACSWQARNVRDEISIRGECRFHDAVKAREEFYRRHSGLAARLATAREYSQLFMIDLSGRVCLITGAAEGIGAELARGFVRRGARVVATDLIAPLCENAELNLAYDVRDENAAHETVARVLAHCGKLDCFIGNAAIMPRQNWDEVSAEDWREVMRVNLDGAWHGAQAAARAMTAQGYGKIVFVSSVEVALGVAVHTHYDAGKAALIGLTRSLARAVGKNGVRVNCVMPGAVLTESELRQFPNQEEVARDMAARQCLPQRLMPQDIEPVFAFLCSAESDCITGQVICADHGLAFW